MTMRMARAPQEHIDRLCRFFQKLEAIVERDTVLLDDDEEEEIEGDMTDAIAQLVTNEWQDIGHIWERILFGFQTLLQCTDPDLTYLDYRPDIKAALVAAGIET